MSAYEAARVRELLQQLEEVQESAGLTEQKWAAIYQQAVKAVGDRCDALEAFENEALDAEWVTKYWRRQPTRHPLRRE